MLTQRITTLLTTLSILPVQNDHTQEDIGVHPVLVISNDKKVYNGYKGVIGPFKYFHGIYVKLLLASYQEIQLCIC